MSQQNIGAIILMLFCVTACTTTDSITNSLTQNLSDATPVVIGQTYTIQSTVYDTTRRVSIKMPVQYASNPEQRFSVVYAIDGGPEQDFPHLAGLLQSVDINYTMEPLILVGIETVKRAAEITPIASDPRYDEIFEERGGASQFREFIRKDVMPWVNNKYRINDDRMVIGESLAGLFIVDTLLNDPTLFNRYAAISPSLWWDNLALVKTATTQLNNMPVGNRELYLSMANEGLKMQKGLDVLIGALESDGPAQLKWHYLDLRNNEHHGSIYHPAALDALRTFYTNPERTGTSPRSFYLFPDGEAPQISERAKKNLELECNKENAITTTFAETNTNWAEWNGMCVQMKTGPARTKGN